MRGLLRRIEREVYSYIYGFRRYFATQFKVDVYAYGFIIFDVPFQLIQIFLSLLSYYYCVVYVKGFIGLEFISYIFTGLILNGILNVALHTPRSTLRSIVHGAYGFRFGMLSMYEYLRLARIPKGVIIVMDEVNSILRQLVFVAVYLVFGLSMGYFKISLREVNLHTLLCLASYVLLGYMAVSAIGFLAASLEVFVAKKYRFFPHQNPIIWTISVLSSLISGVYFPPHLLPKEVQVISFMIPQTHAIMGVREVLAGDYDKASMRFGVLCLHTVTLLPLSLLILHKTFKKIDELR